MSQDASYDLPEIFGLEYDMVERVARRTEQWARGLERVAEVDGLSDDRSSANSAEQLRREVASLYAIAGSYRLILGARDAIEPLRQGARHLAAVGSPYAHALAVCSADSDSVWLRRIDETDRPLTAADRALVLLRLGWLEASSLASDDDTRQALFAHMDRATSVAATEVGRLRLPLDATMRVVRAVDAMLHDEPGGDVDTLAGSAHEFLTRAHDITAEAMNDRFHWSRLMTSVLPVEPEAAAVGAVIMAGAVRRGAADELMQRLHLPPVATAPLVVGREIAAIAS